MSTGSLKSTSLVFLVGFICVNNFFSEIAVGDPKTPNVTFSGKIFGEYGKSRNTSLLNSKIDADSYNYQKLTFDLAALCKSGECTDDCVTAKAVVRAKSILGNASNSFQTGSESISITKGSLLGAHSHEISRPSLWAKELWIEGKINQLFGLWNNYNKKEETVDQPTKIYPTATIKFGMFPFEIGRGIALGSGYGTAKSYLVLYNKNNDFSAPGILVSSKFGQTFLDLYFSKYESKSASSGQTMANKRAKVIGMAATPWAGAGMDEDLYASVLGYEFGKDCAMPGKVYGFVMLDNAPGKTAEVSYDANTMLGLYGAGADFEGKNFEFGFEMAFNFGQEERLEIDRDTLTATKDDNGAWVLTHSHIEKDFAGTWADAPDSKGLIKELKTNPHLNNEEQFSVTDTPGNGNYRTKKNRIRQAFTNYYKGYMAVGDVAYNFAPEGKNYKLRVAATAGIASGDKDPSKSEVNKDYCGFIGIGENYSGKRVSSVMILGDRSTKRPFYLEREESAVGLNSDSSFTDLIYGGVGLNLKPSLDSKFKPEVKVNLLTFNKFDKVYKVIKSPDESPKFSTDFASSHYGWEANVEFDFVLGNAVTFDTGLGIFIPGQYYSDIEGIRLSDDLTKFFDKTDLTNRSTESYTLGSNVAWMLWIEFAYKF